MARRPYPFFSSVGFRTANKVRNGVANWFYWWISYFYYLFTLWILLFVAAKCYGAYIINKTHQPGFVGHVVNQSDWDLTFSQYVQGTWTYVLVPAGKIIGQFLSILTN